MSWLHYRNYTDSVNLFMQQDDTPMHTSVICSAFHCIMMCCLTKLYEVYRNQTYIVQTQLPGIKLLIIELWIFTEKPEEMFMKESKCETLYIQNILNVLQIPVYFPQQHPLLYRRIYTTNHFSTRFSLLNENVSVLYLGFGASFAFPICIRISVLHFPLLLTYFSQLKLDFFLSTICTLNVELSLPM